MRRKLHDQKGKIVLTNSKIQKVNDVWMVQAYGAGLINEVFERFFASEGTMKYLDCRLGMIALMFT
jgi:hypothetical protein